MFADQQSYNLRCEWALPGLQLLAPISDVIVIVDVLSFSTCVDIALSRNAIIIPCRHKDSRAEQLAAQRKALLAQPRGTPNAFSLSPESLLQLPPESRLVLPSPNGSTLCLATGQTPTLIGCFRNAKAVAAYAQSLGKRITLIPAGERWPADNSLRPAIEDILGAGAILHHLQGTRSPEAALAQQTFLAHQNNLELTLQNCSSGRELIERNFPTDITLAAQLNTSSTIPLLHDSLIQNAAAT